MNVKYLDLSRGHESIYNELIRSAQHTLKKGWFILGDGLEDFESRYADYQGTKYCIGVGNGLDAITLSLKALGIKEGDEVIVPSNTYIATLIAVSLVGAKPVLVEPNVETYNIDSENIDKAITKKTRAVIPVHLYGQACEMDKILKVAKRNKINLVEDNAQSHGAMFKGRKTGGFGILNATSFYPGKNLGALGDGGAITTNNKALSRKVRLLRNYGSEKKYFNEILGVNSRLDELQAEFLKIKLAKLDANNKKRNKIASRYLKAFTGVGDIVLPKTADGATHVYHVFQIRIKKRDKLQKHLQKNDIGTLIHYPLPPHLQKAYKHLNFKRGDFPIAEELARTSLSIPIYPELSELEQEYVVDKIKRFYD